MDTILNNWLVTYLDNTRDVYILDMRMSGYLPGSDSRVYMTLDLRVWVFKKKN